jgi:pimeloyl-ACP methyl ester carboxylesterase
MNYVQFNNPKSTKVGIERKVFILLHGYGGGPGLFVDMYERFLDAGHYDAIYGVDLPGLGSSNRTGVDFAYVTWSEKLNPLRSNAERATSELEAARRMTDQYIAGIHMWATEVGLTSFSLGGHSLGGFIAGKYAAKHPDQVDALVLISPIGMGRLPSAEERKMGWFNSIPYRAINMVWSINLSPHIVYRKQTYSKPDVNRMAMQENNFVDWCVGDLERRVGKEAAQWDPGKVEANCIILELACLFKCLM